MAAPLRTQLLRLHAPHPGRPAPSARQPKRRIDPLHLLDRCPPIGDQPEEEWQRLFELNFFASTRLTQAVLPHLLANPNGGSILYISSIVALEATPAPLPYSAAKAALVK